MSNLSVRLSALIAAIMLGFPMSAPAPLSHEPAVDPGPTPQAECGPGSHPETGMQGRASADDHASGRAAEGYWCNTEIVSSFGSAGMAGAGGYRVHRYVDAAGRECAYFDTTLLFPTNVLTTRQIGVYVLDMSDPASPVHTTTLVTPAMLSPHESLSLNAERGLLAAVMGTPATAPGLFDLYDISQDCRYPMLRSSTPVGILGHEGEFAPDGNTYYATSVIGHITAIDVSNPLLPTIAWRSTDYRFHGMSVSDDGNRLYAADFNPSGLRILDVSEVQSRVANPQVREISRLTWPEVSIPQHTIPVTIGGHPYLIEVDEYSSGDRVGAARIIDIADETAPFVVSNLRLQVNMPEGRAQTRDDPGTGQLQDYTAHYCNVPQRQDPGIVACSFILSGLRVFDIRDPRHPVEVAYFNAPGSGASWAMSQPAIAADRGEIWYTDANKGFFAVRVINGMWPEDGAEVSCEVDGLHDPRFASVRAGATVPIRWSASCDGVEQTDPGIVSAIEAVQVDADGNEVGPPAALDMDALRYDANDEHFIYPWRSPHSAAGTRQRVDVTLGDGSTHSTVIAFR